MFIVTEYAALRPNKHSSSDAGCGLRLSNKPVLTTTQPAVRKKPTKFSMKVWAEIVMTPSVSANNNRPQLQIRESTSCANGPSIVNNISYHKMVHVSKGMQRLFKDPYKRISYSFQDLKTV